MARVHDPNVRKIVEQIAKHDREIKGLKNRKPGLGHSSIEDGTIHEYDAEGTLVSQHGKQPDGTHNIVVVNGPKPPKPTEGKVTALPGLIEIRWNGKFAGDAVSPLDLKHVGAYVVPSGDFLDLSDQAGVMTGELGDVLQVQADPGVYNVYLVAWSLAGKFSDAAGPVPVLVTVPADVDAINDALDNLNDRYDGVITEAGNLGNRLNQAEHELTAHDGRLGLAESKVADAFVQIGNADDKAQAAQAAAAEANGAAAEAAGIAGGKADVLIQSTAPLVAMRKATTLWIDTTDGANTPKRWSGSAWVVVTDKTAVDAAAAAVLAGQKAQEALTEAQEAKARAESVMRNSPNLWEWTRDYAGSRPEQMTVTDTEIAYTGTQSPTYANRFVGASKLLPGGRSYRLQAVASNLGSGNANLQLGFYFCQEDGTYISSLWPTPDRMMIPAGASRQTVEITAHVVYPEGVEHIQPVGYFLNQQPMTIHDLKIVDVTSIILASEVADYALTMAGSKTTAYYRTTDPVGTGNQGDIWRRVDAQKNVIAEWFWGANNVWEPSQITTHMISNLDVGKLTVGTGVIHELVAQHIAAQTAAFQTVDIKNLFVTTGTMAEAVINKLWAEVVMSRKITTQMLAIGAFDNLVPDPENDEETWSNPTGTATGMGAWVRSSAGAKPERGPNYQTMDLANDGTQPGTLYSGMHQRVPCEEGQSFTAYAWLRNLAGKPANNFATVQVRIYFYNRSGSIILNAGGGSLSSLPQGVWTRIGGVPCTAPAGAVEFVVRPTIYFNSSSVANGDRWFIGAVSTFRAMAGELVVDGSMKARHIDVEDLAANSGFIADLTSRIIKSDVFQGKEFFGGVFIGSYFWTSPLPNVGLKLDEHGMRVYGPDGGEPVTEIRSDGGTVYSVSDPATGEVLAAIDPDGGIAGQSLSVVGDARLDGTVTIGGDPIPGHGTGESGPTILGRDLLGATYVDHFEQHPHTDGAAWMTALPHGLKLNTYREDTNLSFNATGGQAHYRIRLGGTINTVAGRIYQINYRTPALRFTTDGGGNSNGESSIVYSSDGGSITAGGSDNWRFPESKHFFANGSGWQTGSGNFLVRCPEDIPAGKIMLGIEAYANTGGVAVTSATPAAAAWVLNVVDVGLRRAQYNGNTMNLSKQGTDPTPPPPPVQPDPPKRFVDTVDATWWQAYTGTGAQATGSAYNGAAAQGRTPYYTANGVMRGLIGFPSQSSRLNGATVRKIEVYVYAKSWHAGAGGTAVIGTHGNTSKPGTWSRTTDDVARQKMKRAEGRWITLPSSVHAGFKSGALRGISFYPPSASTSTEYYGIFTGNKTRLRITYDK